MTKYLKTSVEYINLLNSAHNKLIEIIECPSFREDSEYDDLKKDLKRHRVRVALLVSEVNDDLYFDLNRVNTMCGEICKIPDNFWQAIESLEWMLDFNEKIPDDIVAFLFLGNEVYMDISYGHFKQYCETIFSELDDLMEVLKQDMLIADDVDNRVLATNLILRGRCAVLDFLMLPVLRMELREALAFRFANVS